MSKSDEDYPEIGKRRRGMVLVCHGDDRPDQFSDWLQPLVLEWAAAGFVDTLLGCEHETGGK